MTAQTQTIDLTPVATTAAACKQSADQYASILAVEIATPELAQWATDTGKAIRATKREIEAEQKKALGPLKAVEKTIRGWFKPLIEGLDHVEKTLKARTLAFDQAERARQAAALRAATTPAEVKQSVEALAPKPTGLTIRKSYKAKIVNPQAVPAQFWKIDEDALNALASAQKDKFNVPGCELEVVETAVYR